MKIKKIINIVIMLVFLATIVYANAENLCESKPNPCFKELEGVNDKINKLKGLKIGDINYKELQEKSEDITVSIESLYEEASMYKNLALLRTQIEGLPKEVLKELEVKKVEVAKKKKSGKAKKEDKATEEPAVLNTDKAIVTEEDIVNEINNNIIRSHIIELYDVSSSQTMGKLKYFDNNWYWGDDEDYPQNLAKDTPSSKTKFQSIAYGLRDNQFKDGIEMLAGSNIKIIIETEKGKKIKDFENEEKNEELIKLIMASSFKDLKKDYSQTIESHELEVYSGEGLVPFRGLIKDVVYFKYENGWKYKIKKSNQYAIKGDIELPSDWYSDLTSYIGAENPKYEEGIKAITDKLNQKGPGWFKNPSVRINSKIDLPRNREKTISKDELGTLASKNIGKKETKTEKTEIEEVFTNENNVSLNFMDGLKIFIPKEATKKGENFEYYPVLIYLHGNNQLSKFDKFKSIIKNYMNHGGKPIILVEPIDNNKKDVWGKDFDYNQLKGIINSKLNNKGLKTLHISVIGHSAAGCNPNNGIYKIVKQENALYLVGLVDTCYSEKYAAILKENINKNYFMISINNGVTGGVWPEGSRNFGEFENVIETTIPYQNCNSNYYSYCNKNSNNGFISFGAKNTGHNEMPEMLLNEALFPSHNLFRLFT